MPKKFYKIQESELKGKMYFGLFVSTNEEFSCDMESFVRGWELDKYKELSESEQQEFAKGLTHDIAGNNYSPAK